MKDEKEFGTVGNIKISKIKKSKKSNSLLVKVFVWFMFIAMLASFVGPLLYYLMSAMSE